MLRKNSVRTPSQLDVTWLDSELPQAPALRSWFGKLLIAEVFRPDRILADHSFTTHDLLFFKNGRDYRGYPTHHGCAAVIGFSLGLRNSAMVCLNVARPSYESAKSPEGPDKRCTTH